MSETGALLETTGGDLVHAEIGGVVVDRDDLTRMVVIGIPYFSRGIVRLDLDQVAQLAHALTCALVPYGVVMPARATDERVPDDPDELMRDGW